MALVEKNLPVRAGDASPIPGLERNPGVGKCTPPPTSVFLSEKHNGQSNMGGGAIAHGAIKSQI